MAEKKWYRYERRGAYPPVFVVTKVTTNKDTGKITYQCGWIKDKGHDENATPVTRFYQFFAEPYEDGKAEPYPVGTVLYIIPVMTAERVKQDDPTIIFVTLYSPYIAKVCSTLEYQWILEAEAKRQEEAGEQPQTYNKPAKGKTPPPAEEVVEDF